MSGKPIPETVAAEAAALLTTWLDEEECECEPYGHSCGRPNVIRVRDDLLALAAAQQQGQAVDCRCACHLNPNVTHAFPCCHAPPPSAPVGVEGWTAAHALLARFVDELNVRGTMMTIDYDKLRALDSEARKVITSASTLAQQPAAGECPHRTRCDCIAACKYGLAGEGALATQHQEPKS